VRPDGEKFRNFFLENTTAAPITATFITGDGDFEEKQVLVIGNLGALAQVLLSGSPDVASALLGVRNLGFAYGTCFQDVAPMNANTFRSVFTNAQNVRGAIVWECLGWNVTASQSPAAIVLATVSNPPANYFDGDLIDTGDVYSPAAGAFVSRYQRKSPIFIPAAKGLWVTPKANESACLRSIFYSLL
jgi:hypothetical protein